MNKPNNLEPLWMPFTPNKTFKKDPRIIVGAKDMHFISDDNREILDGTAGLWCVNAGHGRKKIQEAVNEQIENLDYSPPFQFGHPKQFELANRLAEIFPEGMNHVFFSNSGSEAVDSALKIALAYQRARPGQHLHQRRFQRQHRTREPGHRSCLGVLSLLHG